MTFQIQFGLSAFSECELKAYFRPAATVTNRFVYPNTTIWVEALGVVLKLIIEKQIEIPKDRPKG